MKTLTDLQSLPSPVALEPQGESKKNAPKRMSIGLTGQTAETLDALAQAQGVTQNEALRKAIGTEAYIREEISQGSRILIVKSDGREVEVVFR